MKGWLQAVLPRAEGTKQSLVRRRDGAGWGDGKYPLKNIVLKNHFPDHLELEPVRGARRRRRRRLRLCLAVTNEPDAPRAVGDQQRARKGQPAN
eukprot:gene13100-biopygen1966